MFHLESNFKSGAPISQVPCSWFNKVANFLNNFVAGYGLKMNKTDSGPTIISIDPAVVPQVSKAVGTPEEKIDDGADDDSNAEAFTWLPGGENGLVLDVYNKCYFNDGWHYLSRCRMTISKDGIITKIEGLPGRREIQS